MKANCKIEYQDFKVNNNCLIVDWFKLNNRLLITPYYYNCIDEFKDHRTIGAWRIKKLKSN